MHQPPCPLLVLSSPCLSHLGASLTPLRTREASPHLHLSSVITSLRSLLLLRSLSVPFNTDHTTPCFSFRGIYGCVELCRKGDPFQRPKGGSCLTLGSELSEETHVLTKQETLLGRGAQVETCRVTEPRRTVVPRGWQSCLLG